MSTYDTALRTAQAAETRRRILAAASAVLDRGLAGLTMAAVAREAGVALRTVYVHFPGRAALLDAVARPAATTHGPLLGGPPPDTLRELTFRLQRAASARAEAMAPGSRDESDSVQEYLIPALTPALRAMPVRERRSLLAAIALLTSGGAVTTARQELALDPGEAGQLLAWAVTTLVRGATGDQ